MRRTLCYSIKQMLQCTEEGGRERKEKGQVKARFNSSFILPFIGSTSNFYVMRTRFYGSQTIATYIWVHMLDDVKTCLKKLISLSSLINYYEIILVSFCCYIVITYITIPYSECLICKGESCVLHWLLYRLWVERNGQIFRHKSDGKRWLYQKLK